MGTSPQMLLLAAAPALAFMVLGLLLSFGLKKASAVAATAFSLGLALAILMLLVMLANGVESLAGLSDSHGLLFGIPVAAYVTSHVLVARRHGSLGLSSAAFGAVGLIGLYYFGGFVLVMTACSYGSGGC